MKTDQFILLEKHTATTWLGVVVQAQLDRGAYRVIGIYKTRTQADAMMAKREQAVCGRIGRNGCDE